MTNRTKYWSVRVIIIVVLSLFAYTGGELLDRATATSETAFCENDKCAHIFGLGFCFDAPGSNRGCDMEGSSCNTYMCGGGGPGDGKVLILQ